MRSGREWLSKSRHKPTRGKSTKSIAVNTKIGTDSKAREEQELAADHAPAAQDARHVDRQPGAIARALAVVALDLAAQVAEHERARRDDQEIRGSKGRRRARPQARCRRSGAAARARSPADRARRRAGSRAARPAAPRRTRRRARADRRPRNRLTDCVTSSAIGAITPSCFKKGRSCQLSGTPSASDQADQDRVADPAVELAAREQGEQAERRQRVGHDAVDQAESHRAQPSLRAESGGGHGHLNRRGARGLRLGRDRIRDRAATRVAEPLRARRESAAPDRRRRPDRRGRARPTWCAR